MPGVAGVHSRDPGSNREAVMLRRGCVGLGWTLLAGLLYYGAFADWWFPRMILG
jgi:hypothetical protein